MKTKEEKGLGFHSSNSITHLSNSSFTSLLESLQCSFPSAEYLYDIFIFLYYHLSNKTCNGPLGWFTQPQTAPDSLKVRSVFFSLHDMLMSPSV